MFGKYALVMHLITHYPTTKNDLSPKTSNKMCLQIYEHTQILAHPNNTKPNQFFYGPK